MRRKDDDYKELLEDQTRAMREVADAHAKLAANHQVKVDVRVQALNMALSHAHVTGDPDYMKDFPQIMLRAETFLAFLLDERGSE